MNADEIRAKWDQFAIQLPKGQTVPTAEAATVTTAFFLAEVAAQLAEIHDDLVRMNAPAPPMIYPGGDKDGINADELSCDAVDPESGGRCVLVRDHMTDKWPGAIKSHMSRGRVWSSLTSK